MKHHSELIRGLSQPLLYLSGEVRRYNDTLNQPTEASNTDHFQFVMLVAVGQAQGAHGDTRVPFFRLEQLVDTPPDRWNLSPVFSWPCRQGGYFRVRLASRNHEVKVKGFSVQSH